MHPSDEKFLQSKLPKRKLEIALERLFSGDSLSGNWRKTYTDYIRARIYPALLYLADQKDYERLRRLLSAGWADQKQRLRLLLEEPIDDVQVRAMLLAAEQIHNPQTAFLPEAKQAPAEDIRIDTNVTAALPTLYPPQQHLLHSHSKLTAAPALLTLWSRRLGLEYPALRNVLASMRFEEIPDRRLPGTDGETIFYHTEQLIALAESQAGYSAYLHMMIHCLFFHILPPKQADGPLWDLACDCAAEILANQMFPRWFSDRKKELRTILHADEQFPLTSAAAIYHLLKKHPERTTSFTGQFVRDDHSQWYRPATPSHRKSRPLDLSAQSCHQRMLRRWAQAANDSKGSTKSAVPRFGLMPGSRQDRMEKKEEGQYDFGRYLKRFSVTGEEMQLDTDSFDYIPYHYGMEHYGNLPFLEPLEYTETNKVEELVIAIDTSGSCSLGLVRRFLGETRKMLTEKEHFFSRMRVHIFQCDSMIQDYRLIHSREEWRRYEDRLSIAGRGGTNFTPVFDRVERMLETGSIKKLKGLLYFSDGDGVYPREKPPCETAFIFPDFRFLELKIPEWVVKICIKQPERL